MSKQTSNLSVHTPVLLKEVLECLKPQKSESYLDLTAGFGGHAAEVLAKTSNPSAAVLIDRDREAIDALRTRFKASGAQVIHSDYLGASQDLNAKKYQFDMILADLGASSWHFDSPGRGFAFSKPGPLDMRMDDRQDLTAEIIVNTWPEKKLANLLYDYGGEPKSRVIARAIVRARPLSSTEQLAAIVSRLYWTRQKAHPATRTFQALRVAINDELEQLSSALPIWLDLLAPGGRLAVISFHSLEDAAVKVFFAQHAANTYDAELTLLTKKPLTASQNETVLNPRARSAKLRACSKNKNKGKDKD